jgi:uncharacterized Zn-finger protein
MTAPGTTNTAEIDKGGKMFRKIFNTLQRLCGIRPSSVIEEQMKTGHWIVKHFAIECSECGNAIDDEIVWFIDYEGNGPKYCPYCGKLMLQAKD